MKRKTLFLLVPFLIACVPSFSSPDGLPSSSEWTTLLPEAEYLSFWQPSQKTITLSMTPETLQWIETYGAEKNNPMNDYYFPISMTVTLNTQTYTLDDVGIRQKGNIFSRGTFLNEEGNLIYPFHFRLSFDQTFDEPFYDELGIRKTWQNGEPAYEQQQKRRLFGMKSLEFKWNRSSDPSLMNQPFASRLFAYHDVVAPQSSLSSIHLEVGDQVETLGIYIVNEAIDSIFIQRHFAGPHAEGDLYKALYPNHLLLDEMAHFDSIVGEYVFNAWMVGVEDTENGYHPVYDLKTNQATSHHEALMKFVKTFKSFRVYNEEDRYQRLSAVLDIPSFIRYVATSFLVGNPDDMRNNQNNAYLYFDGVTQQATIIPYDNDWSLGITWDPSLTEWTATKSPFASVNSFQQPIANPLFWATVIPADGSLSSQLYPLVPAIYETYVSTLQTLASSAFFTPEAYQSLFETYQSYYGEIHQEVAIPNPSSFNSIDAFVYHQTHIQATLENISND